MLNLKHCGLLGTLLLWTGMLISGHVDLKGMLISGHVDLLLGRNGYPILMLASAVSI
jgi:hypothetical protein